MSAEAADEPLWMSDDRPAPRMSRYRSELDALRARIDDLEARLVEARAHRNRLEGRANLGPDARSAFSRAMFHAGRAVGRLLRGRRAWDGADRAALQARVMRLEALLADAEAAVAAAAAIEQGSR
jgi:BMFP domain-containing protein YqiC